MDTTKLTKLGKEVIPVEFAGQNSSYQPLRQPQKPAYPRGDEVRYSDDYIAMINDLYNLEELLGSRKKGIANGMWSDLDHFTMGSPLGCSEGEQVLNGILYNSAHAGLWQPKIIDVPALTDTSIKSAEEYLQAIAEVDLNNKYNFKLDKGLLYGICVAQEGRFVLPTALENKVLVLPAQAFVEYVAQQQ